LLIAKVHKRKGDSKLFEENVVENGNKSENINS